MVTSAGPKVLEYNVRFGDPETEALMLLLDDKTDLAAIMLVSIGCFLKDLIAFDFSWHDCLQACAESRLDSVTFSTRPGFAVSVVLASAGYPGSYPKGKVITEGTMPSGKTGILTSTYQWFGLTMPLGLKRSTHSMQERAPLETRS